MKKKKIFQLTFSILFSTLLVVSLVYASWTAPTQDPPAGNVKAPINVSDAAQSKIGDFGLGGGVGQPLYWLKNIGGTLYFSSTNPAGDRIVIGQDGKVGIGTTAPTVKLDVNGYVKGRSGLCIGNDCRTSWPGGGISGSGSTNYIPKWTGAASLGNSVIYQSGSNVGIGTTNPGEKLHVAGKIKADGVIYSMSDSGYTPATELRTWGINKPDRHLYIEWGNSNDDAMYITDHWRYGSPLYVRTGPIHLMAGNKYGLFVNTNGNVGIGTTNPGAKLEILSSARDQILVEGNNQYGTGIMFRNTHPDNNNEYFGLDWGGSLASGRAGKFGFWYAGTDTGYNTNIMTLTKTGNVGIGTTNPSQKLHVNGNIRVDGRHLYLGSAQDIYGDNSSAIYYDSNHDTVTQMIFRDKQNTQYGRVYGSGNGAYFGLLDGDGNWSYLAAKDNYTQFRINNSVKMTIKSNGNVGIGTTNPQAKLHVNGRIKAQDPIDNNDVATKGYVDAQIGSNTDDEYYILYVTDLVYDGNLGGRTGADEKCDTDPNKPTVCNSPAWAFISVSRGDEIRDFPATKGLNPSLPFVWVKGSDAAIAARDFLDLLDGSIMSPANSVGYEDEYWTGSNSDGSVVEHPFSYTCRYWTSNKKKIGNSTIFGTYGRHWEVTEKWLCGDLIYCNHAFHLLCACAVR